MNAGWNRRISRLLSPASLAATTATHTSTLAMKQETVSGHQALLSLLETEKSNYEKVFVLFMASIDPETGRSWCPDCREADPVVRSILDEKPYLSDSKSIFVTAYVGQRAEWKDASCPFRGEPFNVSCVPTLLRYNKNGPQTGDRLLEGDLVDAAKIRTLLNAKADA